MTVVAQYIVIISFDANLYVMMFCLFAIFIYLFRIMESSENKSVEIVLHTGGSWKFGEWEYTPDNGNTLRQHVLKLPPGFSYLELMDNLSEPAMDDVDLGDGERSLMLNYKRTMRASDVTYCSFFVCDDDFFARFMEHTRTQLVLGKPIELYVGFLD